MNKNDEEYQTSCQPALVYSAEINQNQKSCLRNELHTDVYDILHQYLNSQLCTADY